MYIPVLTAPLYWFNFENIHIPSVMHTQIAWTDRFAGTIIDISSMELWTAWAMIRLRGGVCWYGITLLTHVMWDICSARCRYIDMYTSTLVLTASLNSFIFDIFKPHLSCTLIQREYTLIVLLVSNYQYRHLSNSMANCLSPDKTALVRGLVWEYADHTCIGGTFS